VRLEYLAELAEILQTLDVGMLSLSLLRLELLEV
jgi:hypothetical protein